RTAEDRHGGWNGPGFDGDSRFRHHRRHAPLQYVGFVPYRRSRRRSHASRETALPLTARAVNREGKKMTDNNPLIIELKAHRQRLALSASDVAVRSGLDETLLSRWEDGASSPSLDGVQKWASALGLKLALIPSEQEARRGIRADWQKHRITVDGVPVCLTPMEWRVIERLARTPGSLVSHQELY